MTDPVADLLARIRNAARAHHPKVDVPASKLKQEIVRILKDEGYLTSYKVSEEEGFPVLKIALKYGPDDRPVITNIERVSKPGCRVYVGRAEIRPVLGGMGVNILSTPRGVMTGRDARRQGVGGEVLCQVW
ncbi:MAG: 30S ribosomal protein S8 [Terriglobales bacterium]